MGEIITNEAAIQSMIDLAEKGRSPLAAAMLEDEHVRNTSAERARQYIAQVEAEKNDMPQWMWYLLFFLLGMLFAMSQKSIYFLIYDFIKMSQV